MKSMKGMKSNKMSKKCRIYPIHRPLLPPVLAFGRPSIHRPGGQFRFQIVRPQYALFVERLFQVLYQGWRRPCAFDLSPRPSVTNPRGLNCEESLFARGHSVWPRLDGIFDQQSKPHYPREDSTTTSANEAMIWASECDLIWSVATRATSWNPPALCAARLRWLLALLEADERGVRKSGVSSRGTTSWQVL